MSKPKVEFLGWDKSALELVGERLLQMAETEAEAFRRAVVVVPTAESGRRLKEWVAERAGRPMLMPRIRLAGQLIELQEGGKVASELETLAAWLETLTEQEPEVAWPELFPQPVPARHREVWALNTADMLMRLQEQMEQCEVSIGGLLRRLHGGAPLPDDFAARWSVVEEAESARWRRLESLFAAVDDRLRLWQRVPGREARAMALKTLKAGRQEVVILACLPELSAQVKRFLQERAGQVRAWVNAPEALRGGFDEFGCVQMEYWVDRYLPDALRDECIVVTGSARALARAAVAEAGGHAPDEVALAACDASFTPALVTEFARHGWQVHVPEGRSARTTELAALPGLLAAACEAPDSVSALEPLLRNMAMQRLWSGGELHAHRFALLLDMVQQRYYADKAPYLLTLLQPERPLPGLLRSPSRPQDEGEPPLQVAEREVAGIERLRSYECYNYVRWVVARVALCRKDARAALLLLHEELCSQYANHALQGMAGQMADHVARLAAFLENHVMPWRSVWKLLQHVLEQGMDALEESPREQTQLDALGWKELAYATGKKLILTGLHEGCVPEAPAVDPFLPDSLRRVLGMPSVGSREARDAFLLSALLGRKGVEVRVLLSRMSADGAGAPVAPSTLLYHCPDDALATRVKDKLFDDKNQQPEEPEGYVEWSLSPPDAQVSGAGMESVELIAPQWENIFQRAERRFTPSQINAFLSCPLRFWMKYALGIQPWDEYKGDDKVEMEPSEYGTLMHSVLEDVSLRYRQQSAIRDEAETLAYAMERLEARCAERFGERRLLPTQMRQLWQIRAGLESFVVWHCRELAAGWVCYDCEHVVENWAFPLPDGSVAPVSMRADRIDWLPSENRWRIIDYKTHSDKPDQKHLVKIPEKKIELFNALMREAGFELQEGGKYWKDVQLPMYAAWLSAEKECELPEVAYFNLPRAGSENAGYNPMKMLTEESLASALQWAGSAALLMRRGLCLYSAETFGLKVAGDAQQEQQDTDPRLLFSNLRTII